MHDTYIYNINYSGQYNTNTISIQRLFIQILIITSLQVNKEKLLFDNFTLFPCFDVPMLFKTLLGLKLKSKVVFIELIYTTTTVNMISYDI